VVHFPRPPADLAAADHILEGVEGGGGGFIGLVRRRRGRILGGESAEAEQTGDEKQREKLSPSGVEQGFSHYDRLEPGVTIGNRGGQQMGRIFGREGLMPPFVARST
jgi:hypothetical protein